jgi:hypothetical protein
LKRAENTGWEIQGACIGIVGYCNTGPAIAEFLQGMGMYNPNFRLICAGAPCGDTMSPKTVMDALNI